MSQILLIVSLLAFFLQSSFSQYSYGPGYANNYGNTLANKVYNPTGYGAINVGLAPNIETQANLVGMSSNLATNPVGISPYGSETVVPVATEVSGGYGGSGTGEVAVAGEMPVVGTTNVGGQVPVTGAVRFSGDVPAGGIISVAATCGCAFGGNKFD